MQSTAVIRSKYWCELLPFSLLYAAKLMVKTIFSWDNIFIFTDVPSK